MPIAYETEPLLCTICLAMSATNIRVVAVVPASSRLKQKRNSYLHNPEQFSASVCKSYHTVGKRRNTEANDRNLRTLARPHFNKAPPYRH